MVTYGYLVWLQGEKNDIFAVINALKWGKAAALDGLPTELFRVALADFTELLLPFISNGWKFEIFPSKWKKEDAR